VRLMPVGGNDHPASTPARARRTRFDQAQSFGTAFRDARLDCGRPL